MCKKILTNWNSDVKLKDVCGWKLFPFVKIENNYLKGEIKMKEQIIKIIADYLGKDSSEIADGATFTDIGLDSLDIAELVMEIEDQLDCSIELSQEINTVDKLVEYIEANK